MSRCVVIVPVYRWPLLPTEVLSLVRTLRCLSDYRVVLVGPESIVSDSRRFQGQGD